MRLVVELDLVIKAVLTHLESGECRLSGDLFTCRYVGNGSKAGPDDAELTSHIRSTIVSALLIVIFSASYDKFVYCSTCSI